MAQMPSIQTLLDQVRPHAEKDTMKLNGFTGRSLVSDTNEGGARDNNPMNNLPAPEQEAEWSPKQSIDTTSGYDLGRENEDDASGQSEIKSTAHHILSLETDGTPQVPGLKKMATKMLVPIMQR